MNERTKQQREPVFIECALMSTLESGNRYMELEVVAHDFLWIENSQSFLKLMPCLVSRARYRILA